MLLAAILRVWSSYGLCTEYQYEVLSSVCLVSVCVLRIWDVDGRGWHAHRAAAGRLLGVRACVRPCGLALID
jgi:hypothetical protein